MRRAPIVVACMLALAAVLGGCGEREEPAISTVAEPTFEITGEWRGRLTQRGERPFTVEARIASLERSKQNLVRYRGLDCAGTWDYLGASETAYRFRETIDRGRSRKCNGSGTVTLIPLTDERVDYRFSGGGVTSVGVLARG